MTFSSIWAYLLIEGTMWACKDMRPENLCRWLNFSLKTMKFFIAKCHLPTDKVGKLVTNGR